MRVVGEYCEWPNEQRRLEKPTSDHKIKWRRRFMASAKAAEREAGELEALERAAPAPKRTRRVSYLTRNLERLE